MRVATNVAAAIGGRLDLSNAKSGIDWLTGWIMSCDWIMHSQSVDLEDVDPASGFVLH